MITVIFSVWPKRKPGGNKYARESADFCGANYVTAYGVDGKMVVKGPKAEINKILADPRWVVKS